jgi:hypothetical protein
MLAGFVRCNGGLDNGTALSSPADRRGQVAIAPQPHHRRGAERVCRRALIVALVRGRSDGQCAAADRRNLDRPAERRSPIHSDAGRGQRAACPTEVDAAESLLLLGNSRDRCLPPSVQRQDGHRDKLPRAPAGGNTIAAERQWPSPPELHPPQVAARLSNGLPFTGEALNGRSIIHRRGSPQ